MEKLKFTKEDFANSEDISKDVKFEGYNTPPRLYTLYGMDDAVLNDDLLTLVEDTGMSQGIVSYDEEYYTDSDLDSTLMSITSVVPMTITLVHWWKMHWKMRNLH